MPHGPGDKQTNHDVFRYIERKGDEGATAEELASLGLFSCTNSARCWLSRQKNRGYLTRISERQLSSVHTSIKGRGKGRYYINKQTDISGKLIDPDKIDRNFIL